MLLVYNVDAFKFVCLQNVLTGQLAFRVVHVTMFLSMFSLQRFLFVCLLIGWLGLFS